MLWTRLFLPFAGGYFLSYLYRTVNAVVGPVLSNELSLGAADLGARGGLRRGRGRSGGHAFPAPAAAGLRGAGGARLGGPGPGLARTERQRMNLSGVNTGPLQAGDRVTLTDSKGRRKSIVLREGATWHTTKGAVSHDDLIGGPEGVTVTSVGGAQYLAFRPLMSEFMVSMPRDAAVIYPKDAAQILMWTDIFPGARVLEAGVGSGALSIALLRAIGPDGRLHSYERRQQFALLPEKLCQVGDHGALSTSPGQSRSSPMPRAPGAR